MRKVLITAGLALAPIMIGLPFAVDASRQDAAVVEDVRPPGNGAKDAKKIKALAADLAVAAIGNGAYASMDVDALSAYCVDLALALWHADYSEP